MGKLKTKKAIKKRFRVTRTGKVLHRSNGMRHLRTKKNKARQRRLKSTKALFLTEATKVKKLLGASV